MVAYEIVLSPSPSERLAAAFPEFACRRGRDGQTVLVGDLRDQAELHSVLARMADLGLEIDTVTRLPSSAA